MKENYKMNLAQEITARIERFILDSEGVGISYWGSSNPDPDYLSGLSEGKVGCIDETCAHNSHDPVGDSGKFIPKRQGTKLVFLGRDLEDRFYALCEGDRFFRFYVKWYKESQWYTDIERISCARIPDSLLAKIGM